MYAPLHVHTHFSPMDGVATPLEYIERAASLGMPAVAITDHGTLSGHREFYRVAKEHSVKPILGMKVISHLISLTRETRAREPLRLI